MTRSARAAALVFLAAVVYFSIGAAGRGLWTSDEHRIAEVARCMTTPQGDWLLPHLDGEVYRDKPPLVAWIVALCHGPMGVDLAVAAKVPSILGASLAVLATFLIARRLYGASAGIAAAVVLATTAEFDWVCRRSQYDPLVAGFTSLALWFFVRSRFPDPADPPRPWRDVVLGSLCVGFAGLTKGPVAIAFTVPVILAFAAVAREWRFVATRCAVAVFVTLVPAAVWLGSAWVHGGWSYVEIIVFKHGVGHAMGDVDKVRPWFFYLTALPTGLAPWTLFAPAAVLAATGWRRDDERRADVFALAWVVAPFLLMSCFPAKRDLYLLPLYPGAAICVAKLAAVAEDRLRHPTFAVPRFALAALALVGGLAAVVVAALVMLDADGALASRLDWWTVVRGAQGWAGPVLAAAFGAGMAAYGWKALRAAAPSRAFEHLLAATLIGSMAFAAVALPCADPARSPRAFYEKAATIVGDAPLARYGVDDFAAHWTMRRDVVPLLETRAQAARFLAQSKGPAFLVAERSPWFAEHGAPEGTRVVFEAKLPLDKDLLLLARE